VTAVDDRHEAARLAAVRRYDILDTPPDGAFDRVAALAARLFDTPIGTVTIVDHDRVWFKATHGLTGVRQVDRKPGLCSSVVVRDGVYLIPDARSDPRTLDHPLVRGQFGLRFYAAAPIVTSDGFRLGTVNVIDREPRNVTPAQAAVLEDLAAIVMDHLELRLSAHRLVGVERRERRRVEQLIHRLGPSATAPPSSSSTAARCEVGAAAGRVCTAEVEAKVVDLTGAALWACVHHAAGALTTIPGTFLATQDAPSLADYSGD
jgi:GAF domain-containing protein